MRLRPNKAADPRLDRLADALDTLRALLPRPAPPAPAARPTRGGLAWVGARLANASAGPVGASHRLFFRAHPARPSVATVGNSVAGPSCAVMIWARRAHAAARAAAAIRPAVQSGWAELVIADAGADPATCFLPGLCPEATYLRRPHGFSLADAAWDAAAMTTGPCLVLIGDSDVPLSAAALADIVDSAGADDVAPLADGFLLAVDRDMFRQAGGLDPRAERSAACAAAEFALRAALLGTRTLRPGDPAAREIEAD